MDQGRGTVAKENRSRQWIGASTAALAAVVILAAGVFTFVHGLGHGPQRSLASSKHQRTFIIPSSIQSMTISDDTPVQRIWTLKTPTSTESKVLAWLKTATPYAGNVPTSNVILGSYVGPAELHMTTRTQNDIVISPANYTVDDQGVYEPKYIQNVISVVSGDQTTYLRSPELFTWLKSGQWRTQCTPPIDPLFDSKLRLPNGQVVTPAHSAIWAGLRISLQVQSMPPVQPSYGAVVGNHSTIRSHSSVSTSAGSAILVLNERTQPAASSSKTPVYEYWVIVDRSEYAYAIEAVVQNKAQLTAGKSAVMKLLQNWQVPD